nr:MAG TPA: pentapeptide repeat protein [Caudoviricetes sp.]
MKITQERLNEIIVSHGKWLRDEENGKRADLRGANLGDANLVDTDFEGANLRNAYLRSANLRSANLGGADLRGADLRGANLGDADLRGAHLVDAYLVDAYLVGTYFDKTYYQITRIGSRNATTTYCVEDDNVVCGCWNGYKGGTLEEFRKRVESVYGENGEIPNEKYYGQYIAAIEFFEKMAELAKKEEEK